MFWDTLMLVSAYGDEAQVRIGIHGAERHGYRGMVMREKRGGAIAGACVRA